MKGPVEDVRFASVVGYRDCVVLAPQSTNTYSSPALADLGSIEDNRYYLKSVSACPDPEIVTKVGIRVRSKDCNAKIGKHALSEYLK